MKTTSKNGLPYLILLLIVGLLGVNLFFISRLNSLQKQNSAAIDTLVEIQKESHLGDLLVQYFADLETCYAVAQENAELTERKCKRDMMNSEIATLIKKWGGEKYINPSN